MAKKKDGADVESAPSEPKVPAAPPVSAKAKAEVELPDAFKKGGQFSHAGNPRCKGYESKIAYTRAIYTDSDGVKYPAMLCPLPLNKGSVFAGPNVENANDEMNKIAKLPFEKQVEALADLTARMQSTCQYFLLKGTRTRLCSMNGVLLKTVQVQDDKGGKLDVPIADLIVNFSKEDGIEDWRNVGKCMHKDYVPPMRKGASNCQTCFELA